MEAQTGMLFCGNLYVSVTSSRGEHISPAASKNRPEIMYDYAYELAGIGNYDIGRAGVATWT